ncbi:hypothetical protein AbraCBS73388_002771 [Aspergillus brasiliensis]|uniref:Uncharacterized protein n=1 Tax=Aspergillus brasiliensis TaxID=319629 RepID=A0A9W6DTI5_9EURO|nr:hypothetical protein AbraCBS73388_002771 [Aspergillus brasiliensis]
MFRMFTWTIDLLLICSSVSSVQAFNTFHTNCTLPSQHASLVTAPNTRGTLQILWSSLFTILACTWTVVHLNVPKYKPKPHIKDFKKWLKWMVDRYQHPTKWFLLTVIAPEIPFAKYWDDQARAHSLFYHYENVFMMKNWTRTHVLFANMGGFALRYAPHDEESPPGTNNEKVGAEILDDSPSGTVPPVQHEISQQEGSSSCNRLTSVSHCGKTTHQTQPTLTDNPAKKFEGIFYLTAIEALKLLGSEETLIPGLDNVSVEEINDRSKSDLFMRLLAVGQILWVVIQILSRWAYGLAVSQLEVTVVAFAFCAVGIYLVNHGKPKGVNYPILLDYPGSKEALIKELQESSLPDSGGKHNKWKFYRCKYCDKEKRESHGSTSIDRSEGNDKNDETANSKERTDSHSEAITRMNRETNSETVLGVPIERVELTSALDTFTTIIQVVREIFRSSRKPGDPIGNGFIIGSEDQSESSNVLLTDMWMFIGIVLFGGVHFIAWDFQFPTTVEKYLWRAAALWCTVCVLACTLLYFVCVGVLNQGMEVFLETTDDSDSSASQDTKPNDPVGPAPTVSSTSPNRVSSNPDTDLDVVPNPNSPESPRPETEKSAVLTVDRNEDVESQGSLLRRKGPIKEFTDLLSASLRAYFLISRFLVVILLWLLWLVCMLGYIVARLFIVVEMFRTLAFLPSSAYVATWSSEIPNLG